MPLGEKLYPFYPLVNVYIANWNITMLLMGKSTINGPFSIAMFVYQRVMGLKSFPHGLGTAPRAEVTDPGFIIGKAFAVVFFGRGQGW